MNKEELIKLLVERKSHVSLEELKEIVSLKFIKVENVFIDIDDELRVHIISTDNEINTNLIIEDTNKNNIIEELNEELHLMKNYCKFLERKLEKYEI